MPDRFKNGGLTPKSKPSAAEAWRVSAGQGTDSRSCTNPRHTPYLADDRDGALDALDRFTDLYATGDLPEFHSIVDTIIAWGDQILDWHDTADPQTAESKEPTTCCKSCAEPLTDSPTPTISPPKDSF